MLPRCFCSRSTTATNRTHLKLLSCCKDEQQIPKSVQLPCRHSTPVFSLSNHFPKQRGILLYHRKLGPARVTGNLAYLAKDPNHKTIYSRTSLLFWFVVAFMSNWISGSDTCWVKHTNINSTQTCDDLKGKCCPSPTKACKCGQSAQTSRNTLQYGKSCSKFVNAVFSYSMAASLKAHGEHRKLLCMFQALSSTTSL